MLFDVYSARVITITAIFELLHKTSDDEDTLHFMSMSVGESAFIVLYLSNYILAAPSFKMVCITHTTSSMIIVVTAPFLHNFMISSLYSGRNCDTHCGKINQKDQIRLDFQLSYLKLKLNFYFKIQGLTQKSNVLKSMNIFSYL